MIYYIGFSGDNGKYKGVYLSDPNDVKTNFNTGDFIKDWFNLNKHINTLAVDGYLPHCTCSSQINHLGEYGFDYDSKYLNEVGGEYVLSDDYNGIEFFVNEDIKTWEELKEYCK